MSAANVLIVGALVYYLANAVQRGGGPRRSARRSEARRASRPAARLKAKPSDDLASRLQSGEISGDALRELMGSGQLRFAKNPSGSPVSLNERQLSATERRDLERARDLSREFHGTSGLVLDLEPGERQASRFAVALGSMPAIEYEPRSDSDRSGYIWRHESGDRGDGVPKAKGKPLLAVDARTQRPIIVPMHSSMALDPERGLVG